MLSQQLLRPVFVCCIEEFWTQLCVCVVGQFEVVNYVHLFSTNSLGSCRSAICFKQSGFSFEKWPEIRTPGLMLFMGSYFAD